MRKLKTIFTILILVVSANLGAVIQCPSELSYDQLSQIKSRKLKIYNLNFYPIGDFTLPWTSVLAKYKNEHEIDNAENHIACEYEYLGIGGKSYTLKVGVTKPNNINVQCALSLQDIQRAVKDIQGKNGKLEDTTVVFDWDETISNQDGNYELREKSAPALMSELSDKKMPLIVLTARGLNPTVALDPGYEITMNKQVSNMLEKLGKGWKKNEALITQDLKDWGGAGGKDRLISKDDIVFAGGVNKGRAMIKLIEHPILKKRPSNIIFIDNSPQSINDFAEAFIGRKEQVYIFHFPKKIADKPCSWALLPRN